MKRILALLLLSVAAVSLVLAAEKKKKSRDGGMNADEQAIRKIESDWGTALVKGDAAALDRFTTADWTFTSPTGEFMGKAEANADVKSGDLKFESMKLADLKIRLFGDTAIAHGLSDDKGTHKGKDISGQYRFTDVFVKRDGKWMCVSTHVSKVVKS